MKFNQLIQKLKNGKTFEEIYTQNGGEMVECVGNAVYDDQDLYDFLEDIGAAIADYKSDHVIIKTRSGETFKIPAINRPNRFDDEAPDETILLFNIDEIIVC